jgi:hypothetical protein
MTLKSAMVRLVLVVAPIVCLLGAVAMSCILKYYFIVLFHIILMVNIQKKATQT